METINIGFIGAGDIADLHAKAINDLSGANLVGLWNRTSSKAQLKAKQFGCKVYETVDVLLNDPQIDAVFILTNMETHCEYTIRAAKAGKHILVEKPAASNISELEEMQKAIKKAKVKCMPVHNYIYEAGILRTKRMIDEGLLGDITQFYMMYNIQHSNEIRARYPGVIKQILTHHAYTMLYLAGKPQMISCMKTTIDPGEAPQENLAMCMMKMENGSLSHLAASFANDDHAGDPWTCMIKVIGTKGSTRFSYRDWVINERNGAHSQTYNCYHDSIKNTAIHFIDRVIRHNEAPLSSIEDAITCQRIVETCQRSVDESAHIAFS